MALVIPLDPQLTSPNFFPLVYVRFLCTTLVTIALVIHRAAALDREYGVRAHICWLLTRVPLSPPEMGHKSPLYDTQYHEDTNNISSGWDIDIDDLYYTSDHIRGPHIPPETNQYLTDSHPPTAPYHGGYSGYLPNDMSTVETATYPQYSTYGFEEDYMFEAEPFANHFRQGRLEGPHYHQPGSSDPSSLSFHPSELAYAGYEETHSQSSIATSSAITTN